MTIYADLGDFDLGAMVRLVAALRKRGAECSSAREYAQQVCELLHASFVGPDGLPQTALVRLYTTTRVQDLPPGERPDLPGDTTCLTLLGTAGRQPEWNDRARSVGHKVLPLVHPEQVAQMPMIAGLLEQLGVDVAALTGAGDQVMLPISTDRCRIFYVPDAVDSPLIPAQDFVREHGIVSAVGFGGALMGGDVFAVVLFSTVPITRPSAELFETVALSLGLAALDLVHAPLLGDDGPERRGDVTPESVLQARVDASAALVRAHERVSQVEADRAVFAQAQAEYDARRTASLAAVALRLGNVESVAHIPDILVSDGLVVLGAHGVSIALTDPSGLEVDVMISSAYDDETAQTYARLPLDDALPTTFTARTGEICLVADTEAEDLAFPAMRELGRQVGLRSVACLPLQVRDRLIGALTCTWEKPQEFDLSGLEVMLALAAQVAQSADRARLLEREREHSTALQRSLLSEPPPVDDCQVEVRYLPAAAAMQVGGDWYDVFPQVDGATMLVIGDVVGHDTAAAAAMGQVRGLMRGVAWTGGGPAEVLRRVDEAVDGLALGRDGHPDRRAARARRRALLVERRPPPADAHRRGRRGERAVRTGC